jgi:hypothetical protein
MGSYFRILAAIPGFFVSALITMLLWGVIAPQFGLDTIGYPTAMLITITLWLTVGPLAFAAGRANRGWARWRERRQQPPGA